MKMGVLFSLVYVDKRSRDITDEKHGQQTSNEFHTLRDLLNAVVVLAQSDDETRMMISQQMMKNLTEVEFARMVIGLIATVQNRDQNMLIGIETDRLRSLE